MRYFDSKREHYQLYEWNSGCFRGPSQIKFWLLSALAKQESFVQSSLLLYGVALVSSHDILHKLQRTQIVNLNNYLNIIRTFLPKICVGIKASHVVDHRFVAKLVIFLELKRKIFLLQRAELIEIRRTQNKLVIFKEVKPTTFPCSLQSCPWCTRLTQVKSTNQIL